MNDFKTLCFGVFLKQTVLLSHDHRWGSWYNYDIVIRLGKGIWAKFGLVNGIYTPLQEGREFWENCSMQGHAMFLTCYHVTLLMRGICTSWEPCRQQRWKSRFNNVDIICIKLMRFEGSWIKVKYKDLDILMFPFFFSMRWKKVQPVWI